MKGGDNWYYILQDLYEPPSENINTCDNEESHLATYMLKFFRKLVRVMHNLGDG